MPPRFSLPLKRTLEVHESCGAHSFVSKKILPPRPHYRRLIWGAVSNENDQQLLTVAMEKCLHFASQVVTPHIS